MAERLTEPELNELAAGLVPSDAIAELAAVRPFSQVLYNGTFVVFLSGVIVTVLFGSFWTEGEPVGADECGRQCESEVAA